MDLQPGTKLGPYEILAPIGAGGMGEVYKAADVRLNRTVAIKVLPAQFSENLEMRQRLDGERGRFAGLGIRHSGVLKVGGGREGPIFSAWDTWEGGTWARRDR